MRIERIIERSQTISIVLNKGVYVGDIIKFLKLLFIIKISIRFCSIFVRLMDLISESIRVEENSRFRSFTLYPFLYPIFVSDSDLEQEALKCLFTTQVMCVV